MKARKFLLVLLTVVMLSAGLIISASAMLGDVDNNGKIDARDYAMVKRYVLHTFSLTDEQLAAADIDGNGKVQAIDYAKIKRHILGTYKIVQPEEPHVHSFSEWATVKEATCTENGLQERSCVCDLKETRSFGYHGNYGYTSLAAISNGSKMQALYDEIDRVAVEFHSNTNLNAENNIVGKFNYSAFGLTGEEAIAVWKIYKNDHPLYYWISATANYDSTDLVLLTDDIYAQGSDRLVYNEIVYNGIKEYAEEVSKKEDSPYLIALAFHDKIILSMEYAYESDGSTPENDAWAHNILGVFEKKTGVCEAYAKTFQLLLNYCGVDNIYVTGYATEPHAWNLAKMDDGSWYWFDLTWDDKSDTNSNTLDWTWGIWYNYFCVNDTKDVASYYCWSLPYTNFLDNHTPETPLGTGIDFLYSLPSRSKNETITKQHYALSQMVLPDEQGFTVDGILYNVAGYNTALVASINSSGKVEIPETVTYNGRTYEVIAVYNLGNGITSITIPKTVKFIPGPLNGKHLTDFIVDKDNPYFTAKDGVLFTKNLYTLIAYPFDNPRTEYTIPDEVHDIAYPAFGLSQSSDGGDTCHYLSTLILGANVSGVGRDNAGWGYRDKEIVLEDDEVFFDQAGYITGYWPYIYKSLKGEQKTIVSGNNPYYNIEGGVLYSDNWILCVLDQSITKLHITENISEIPSNVFEEAPFLEAITVDPNNKWFFVYDNVLYRGSIGNPEELVGVPRAIKGSIAIINGLSQIPSWSFSNCTNLVSVTIPASVNSIGYSAFTSCTSLQSVVIPNSVTFIDSNAFHSCSSLESITLPDGITSIPVAAFLGCTSLKSITLPSSLISIGDAAFWECTSLSNIAIPVSVTHIGEHAIFNCVLLTRINFEGTIEQWNAINKVSSWDDATGSYTIYCTDGNIAK